MLDVDAERVSPLAQLGWSYQALAGKFLPGTAEEQLARGLAAALAALYRPSAIGVRWGPWHTGEFDGLALKELPQVVLQVRDVVEYQIA